MLLATLLLVSSACSGRETPPKSVEANEPIPAELALGAGECEDDADCVLTTFEGCCASPDGTCPCALQAMSAAGLEEALDDCAATECTHGACPRCDPPPPGAVARCARTACRVDRE